MENIIQLWIFAAFFMLYGFNCFLIISINFVKVQVKMPNQIFVKSYGGLHPTIFSMGLTLFRLVGLHIVSEMKKKESFGLVRILMVLVY